MEQVSMGATSLCLFMQFQPKQNPLHIIIILREKVMRIIEEVTESPCMTSHVNMGSSMAIYHLGNLSKSKTHQSHHMALQHSPSCARKCGVGNIFQVECSSLFPALNIITIGFAPVEPKLVEHFACTGLKIVC